MSARERAKFTLASIGWLVAAAVAVALGDIHKMFVLTVSGAAVITLSIIVSTTTRRRTEIIASALKDLAKKTKSDIPLPVDIAHQVGFKQGWEARERQNPDNLHDLVAVFEKRFPAPPN